MLYFQPWLCNTDHSWLVWISLELPRMLLKAQEEQKRFNQLNQSNNNQKKSRPDLQIYPVTFDTRCRWRLCPSSLSARFYWDLAEGWMEGGRHGRGVCWVKKGARKCQWENGNTLMFLQPSAGVGRSLPCREGAPFPLAWLWPYLIALLWHGAKKGLCSGMPGPACIQASTAVP